MWTPETVEEIKFLASELELRPLARPACSQFSKYDGNRIPIPEIWLRHCWTFIL
jgi:hypothetical protein